MLLLMLACATPPARAQCALQVQPGEGLPGVDGRVYCAVSWDPDGAGPQAPLVVVGGDFNFAGSVAASNIAAYDAATGAWSALGSGADDVVVSLAVLADGKLVAGGGFYTIGGVSAHGIAAWDGTAWYPLGTGINLGAVAALLVLPNGDLLAGGTFYVIGGQAAEGVARWDGTAWSAVGPPLGMHSNGVVCFALLPNGDVVAGGDFSSAAGGRVSRWNGTTWSPMGLGMNRAVRALHVRQNGELLAGGEFTLVGSTPINRVARWTGSAWVSLGSGLTWTGIPATTYADEIVSLPNGDVLVGGFFNFAGGVPAVCVARWNGSVWSADAQGPVPVEAMAPLPGGTFVVGGQIGTGVAIWNGIAWTPMGAGIGSQVHAAVALPNGDSIVGGSFRDAGGQRVDRIARRGSGGWSPLGSGMNDRVQAVATLANGDVIAGGAFTTAGGAAANRIARWDGSTWSPLGTGFTMPNIAEVYSLLPLPNGDVIAGGWMTASGVTPLSFIARWDGTTWSSLGSGTNNIVFALARLPNGDVIAGGDFTTAGGAPANHIARWNGSAWSPLGSGVSSTVEGMAVRPDGQLVVVGRFTTAGGAPAHRVALWNGTTWSSLGSGLDGMGLDVAVLPNGDSIVVGHFAQAGGTTANRVARHGATGWSALALGVTGVAPFTSIDAVELLTDGTLLFGGSFHVGNGAPSANIATMVSPCPAMTAAFGSGCAGAGGPNVLAATALPWIGSTFRARATGMPPLAFVVAATGFTTLSLPLSSVLPQGQPGCSLLVSPDFLDVLLPVAGTADSQLALPNTPSLVGLSFHHQMVPLELDLSFAITAVTSTNALAATIGAF